MAKRTLKADTLVEELFRSGYLKKEIQLETFFFKKKKIKTLMKSEMIKE